MRIHAEMKKCYSLNYKFPGITDEYASVDCWLKDKADADKVIMTPDKIRQYNRSIEDTDGCGIVDITKVSSEHQSYGIITAQTDVRSEPVDGNGTIQMDMLQESTMKIGEGVIILHSNSYGDWLYVQGHNYAGWVKQSNVAGCTRKELSDYVTSSEFILVTAPADVRCSGEQLHFEMGCRLMSKTDKTGKVIAALRPVRDKEGKIGYKEMPLYNIEYHRGYLPYTNRYVLDQAMKLLNIPYGWGNADNLLDCSGTVVSVYDCFGISIPRNTSAMAKCPHTKTDVSGMAFSEKKELLKNIMPGSLIITKGHVMLFLGVKCGEPYVLHNFTAYKNESGNIQHVNQCTITPLDFLRKNESTMLEDITTIVEVKSI